MLSTRAFWEGLIKGLFTVLIIIASSKYHSIIHCKLFRPSQGILWWKF